MGRVVVFFGMTASGKSTLASAWAERVGAPYYNTDRVRKQLVGLQATDRRPDAVGQGIYAGEWSARTYAALLERAGADLAAGADTVVLDGSYARREDREGVRRMARAAGARCVLVWCVCSEKEVKRRLALRARDREAVSDGRWEIYLHQLQTFERPEPVQEPDCLRLDTEREVGELLAELAVLLSD